MILTVFCPLKIQSDGETVWEERSPNISSTQRPLSLQLGKESREAYKSQSLFNKDMKALTKSQDEFYSCLICTLAAVVHIVICAQPVNLLVNKTLRMSL